MAIAEFFNRQNPESGLTAKSGRHKFKLTRQLDPLGSHVYFLENCGLRERIRIPRFLFDRFRAIIRDKLSGSEQSHQVDIKLNFASETWFVFRSGGKDYNGIYIEESKPLGATTGGISIPASTFESLDQLLYHKWLGHPNDVLMRIISYHKLFQFTFVDGSESITSNLSLRRDVLASIEKYVPSVRRKSVKVIRDDSNIIKTNSKPSPRSRKKVKSTESDDQAFKSRLGEKDNSKSYAIDYHSLFSKGQSDNKSPKVSPEMSNTRSVLSKTCMSLPLSGSDIKSLKSKPWRCEFDKEEVKHLRDYFLVDRDSDFYVGFEVVDAVFRSHGRLKSYRFPLYYMKVTISESGRYIFIHPPKDNKILINHIALANLVQTYAPFIMGQDAVDNFFKTLLAQSIEVDGQVAKVSLSRLLPCSESVFDRIREVLLGYEEDNGKGGILSNLKIIGIECDLEATSLYKAARITSPLAAALDYDLNQIADTAMEYPKRFYHSLLGRFLSPETARPRKDKKPFYDRAWMPGFLPKSSRNLLQRLNDHDLVLLEGPPGTGKTFTIRNLLIHCVNSNQRIMVVSDQVAAIHALTEKMTEYLFDGDIESPQARNYLDLWNQSVKVIDEAPATGDLDGWVSLLTKMLDVENSKDIEWPVESELLESQVIAIDNEIDQWRQEIQKIMAGKLGPSASTRKRVAIKRQHATTISDIEALVDFLSFIGHGGDLHRDSARTSLVRTLLIRFINSRDYMAHKNLKVIYDYFNIPANSDQKHITNLYETIHNLEKLKKVRPRSVSSYMQTVDGKEFNEVFSWLKNIWESHFPEDDKGFTGGWRRFKSYFRHPCMKSVNRIYEIVKNQYNLLSLLDGEPTTPGVWRQLQEIHETLRPENRSAIPLSLEICRYALESNQIIEQKGQRESSVQDILEQVAILQQKRDQLIKKRFLAKLGEIATRSFAPDEKGGTNRSTTISALLNSLKTYKSVENAADILKELKQVLWETFPIWICRKQAVPSLFPCEEQSFDLVIVDEATQCRVDDALPLLFRAKKLMVVGDEKQTVLAKNSVIDDYLFNEFALDEHLRTTQARGIKGGGSHIFGLVKGIKQASVLLDEHYRCPPEIIAYSNKYVYGSELKVMQWDLKGKPASVIIDYSEEKNSPTYRSVRGKYKGIDVEMMDRFLNFVYRKLRAIEKETGKRINIDTDVAICYFLLKNEAYMTDVKGEFIRRVGRGDKLLDGAGAALQGKERDYIFYYWDITRSNMMAFRQGDEEDKRKGELNVLMSRPKKRAYHFLHHSFRNLHHDRATITDFLWKTLEAQGSQSKNSRRKFVSRKERPAGDFVPWRRSSGPLMEAIFNHVMPRRRRSRSEIADDLETENSIVVGDPSNKIDLMILPNDRSKDSVAVIDLAAFDPDESSAERIMDYFFQLRRASPGVDPVFTFIYELADERTKSFKILHKKVEGLQKKDSKRKRS